MSGTVNIKDLRTTSKMVAKDAGFGNIKTFFESQKATLLAVLPKHVSADRMLKIALGAMRTTPKLMNCTVESLMGAIVQCSQLGLEPNTPLGHAYLIPFDKKKKVGSEWIVEKVEVQIIFGYKGLIDLSRRSGQIISISAHEVCANDDFQYEYGLDEKLVHKPAMGDRGDVIAFYAVAKLVGGGHAFEVMSHKQVTDIRDASQGWQTAVRNKKQGESVWGKHFIQMGRKTALRRLFNYLPVSIELATASALDGQASMGESQALDSVLTGEYSVIDEEAPDSYTNDESESVAAKQEGPDLNAALAAAKSGDTDLALDIASGLDESEQAIVSKAIEKAEAKQEAEPEKTTPRRQQSQMDLD
jgi:recombination protein RecT